MMDSISPQPPPSPALFFDTITGYQRTAALQAGIELELFTALAEGCETARQLASRCGAAERGMRILADYLVALGFLTKAQNKYGLTPDSALFLDKHSPAYLGTTLEFLLSPMMHESYQNLTQAVRQGGTALAGEGTVSEENPVWVRFARAMMPMMAPAAQHIAKLVEVEPTRPLKVLDIAAGHGLFGIAFAQRNPKAEIIAVDWPQVLEVAQENAEQAGVGARYSALRGNAFEVDFGKNYDVVLLTNFLHHFDVATCESLLRKVHASLTDGGRAVTLEFIPNEDRVTPAGAAMFSMTMLASTRQGDAYTFAELNSMFQNAGFSQSELHPIPLSYQSVVVSHK